LHYASGKAIVERFLRRSVQRRAVLTRFESLSPHEAQLIQGRQQRLLATSGRPSLLR